MVGFNLFRAFFQFWAVLRRKLVKWSVSSFFGHFRVSGSFEKKLFKWSVSSYFGHFRVSGSFEKKISQMVSFELFRAKLPEKT
jgi:hypothetical protein